MKFQLSAFVRVSPEERRRRKAELDQKIKDGVLRIQRSPEFREYLIAMSRFHTYSWHNQMLIMLQRPDATFVRGYNGWKDLGRSVKVGETGIRVLAPSGPTAEVQWVRAINGAKWEIRRVNDEWGVYRNGRLVDLFKTQRKTGQWLRDQGAVAHRQVIEVTHFTDVTVFDIKQTEGKSLPEFVVPVLTGEMDQKLFDSVLALMKKRGVSVSFESRPHLDPETKGQFMPPNQIWVRPEEPPAQRLKTLLHEVAHYYSAGVFQIPRADAETIAESAAFVVGAHQGFDTGVRSFPYVALWVRDEETLNKNLEAVHSVAEHIIEELEGTEPRSAQTVGTRKISDLEVTYSLERAKAVARERGLSTSGSKRDILRRLSSESQG